MASVLAVDLDELTMERVKSAVRGTEFTAVGVSPGEALDHVAKADVPVIILLPWSAEQEEELSRLCDALRAATRSDRCYIVALGALSERSVLLHAAEGPANDVLSRPFGGDMLLVRLRQALRAMRGAKLALTPRDALQEALASAGGGEVVVRSGDVAAWIHVQDGHIVWVNVSSVPTTMDDVTRHGGLTLDREALDAVREESRRTGAHFMDVLVRWGLISEERAREAVRTVVDERVKLVLELPEAVGLFLPKVRAQGSRLRFRASEIPSLRDAGRALLRRQMVEALDFSSGGPPPSSRAPALPLVEIALFVEEAAAVEGAVGAAILDRKTGVCLHHSGIDIDTQIAWSQVSTLAALGPDAGEAVASAGDRCYLARPLLEVPSLVLFVVFSLSETTLGLARIHMASLTSKPELGRSVRSVEAFAQPTATQTSQLPRREHG